MRWRLLKSTCLLATLGCIGLAIVCVRSFWIADAWGWSSGKRSIQCGVAGGRLRLDTTLLAEDGGQWPKTSLAHVEYPASIDPPTQRLPASFANLGFSIERKSQARNYTSRLLLIPMWAPIGLLSGLAEGLRRLARRALYHERKAHGLCPYCGYDVRATPDSCPECGR